MRLAELADNSLGSSLESRPLPAGHHPEAGTPIGVADDPDLHDALKLVLETALDAVIVIDAQSTIIAWNACAEDVFGWSQREALGRTLAELIIPERHRVAHHRGLTRFLATGHGPLLRKRLETTA